MTRIELETVEESPSTSVETGPTTTTRKESRPWHFALGLLISFVEALGRSSEEFYVYLPPAVEPRNREVSHGWVSADRSSSNPRDSCDSERNHSRTSAGKASLHPRETTGNSTLRISG
jgi:hypothetical protein